MHYGLYGFGTAKFERIPSQHDGDPHHGTRVGGNAEGSVVGPSLTPPATPFLFSVDGSGILSRCSSSSHGGQMEQRPTRSVKSRMQPTPAPRATGAVGGHGRMHRSAASTTAADRQGVRPPTSLARGGYATSTSSTAPAGVLPSAASPALTTTTMSGSGCAVRLSPSANAARAGPRPSSAGPPLRAANTRGTSAAAAAVATPRMNNYVVGQAASSSLRAASANRAGRNARPPRVPTATSLSTSPSLTRASSCETSASSLHRGEREAVRWPFGEALSNARPTTAGEARTARHAGQQTPSPPPSPIPQPAPTGTTTAATAAPPPVRPLLRRLPFHSSAERHLGASSKGGDKSGAAEAASEASASTTPSDSSLSSRTSTKVTRRPHVPLMQMTRTSALRRPVLLTRDTSTAAAAAAAAVAAGGKGGRATPRPPPPEAPRTTRLANASDTPTGAPYAPAPPRASTQPQRLRRASRASTAASNSSATLHPNRRSVDAEAAAARLFFLPIPSSTDADSVNGRRGEVDGEERQEATLRPAGAAPVPDAVPPSRHPQGAGRSGEGSSSAIFSSSISLMSPHSVNGTENNQSHHHPPQQLRRTLSRGVRSTSEVSRGAANAAAGNAGVSSVVERLRERGNQYMLREEFGQAIATYSEAIRLTPGYDVLWGNRAAAFLLTFRYLPAVADCLYVLNVKPGSVKAYWRAAKAYAAAYRFLEAKKYYLLAQQACLKEAGRCTSAASDGAGGSGGGDLGSTSSLTSVSGKLKEITPDASEKAAKERRAIAAEEQAVETVELYWQHVRAEQWPAAVAVMDKILALPSYTGPTAVSWQALRLEALLPLEPKTVLAEAEALHKNYPEALELYYVLAKALFYTVHDATSTQRCLQLLDTATERRSAQNTMLNVHVRYAAMQLRESFPSEGGDTSAVQLEAWARRNQLREDSRVAELRYSIDRFARHRDAGNAAYEKGQWDAAAAAYTQCLQTDRLNHTLLAAVYSNRTAVYMQAGRWREALSDADMAIQLSPQLATAYARRGRIQLYLLAQEYEAQRAVLSRHFTTQWSAAVKEQLTQYADAAAADLTRAVELSPTAEHKMQLQQALAQRLTMKTALSAQPTRERQGSAASTSQAGPRPGSASSNGGGFGQQRSYPNSRPTSSASFAPAPYAVLQQHLQLLGLHSVSSAAGALPDVKVIAKAYRESALRWHPDKWVSSSPQEQQEAERHFKLISVAYTALRERCSEVANAT